jgi:hypothetical protein
MADPIGNAIRPTPWFVEWGRRAFLEQAPFIEEVVAALQSWPYGRAAAGRCHVTPGLWGVAKW